MLYALWTNSKRSCDLLAPEETKTNPTRHLPDPSSKASQKKRKLKAKKKRKQRRQKNGNQPQKDIEREVHAKSERSSDRSSAQHWVHTKSPRTENGDESNGAERNRRSPDGTPKRTKTVRFSLEDNQVHILPKTKRKRKVNRSLFF
uniref:Uncharacterized protein n=1 Tax=Rhodosorus marinus TaxID=101924 RepID=A0A7S0BK97_9RHOD|mmetsp:Transcript_19325/g.28018  ORF Transcript_19325/g.28018 Transcript_19325/m.28018 type:complete len:146 (+) Transcript_19325:2-439(+)